MVLSCTNFRTLRGMGVELCHGRIYVYSEEVVKYGNGRG
jgi:hypothetical protein